MSTHTHRIVLVLCLATVCVVLLAVAACAPGGVLPAPPVPITPTANMTAPLAATPSPAGVTPSATAAKTATPWPTAVADRWQEVNLWTPYPFTTPLPPSATTPIDGLYVYDDTVHAPSRAPCRRCPPYPPLAGIWRLKLDKGIFRVIHPNTGWRTLGSFAVDGDQITLFNDPNCHLAVGVFGWQAVEGGLTMQLLNDDCELGTRALLFTGGLWQNCQPPNQEAAVSGHWKTPSGCE